MKTLSRSKIRLLAGLVLLLIYSCSTRVLPLYSNQKSDGKPAAKEKWQLVFADDFTSNGDFDTSKWSYALRSTPAWTKYLTSSPRYVRQQSGKLILRMDNQQIPGDDVPYHSAGIQTKGKFSFTYGKVEVRARFKEGRGAWPAIWMMPEDPTAYWGWPHSGEIDIMEHVNLESQVHQTIHSGSNTSADGGSAATSSGTYKAGKFNTYSIVWDEAKIEFYVNKQLRYTYHKEADGGSAQWPFNQPFYLILNQSGGAGWPGAITDTDLPFEMEVDYVKVYQKR
jgi:beta-glucanase (GH16 family)